MIRYAHLSYWLMLCGFLLFLLVTIDRFCFDNALLDGRFLSSSIALETHSVDFGDVTASDEVRREIAVENTGRSSLVLERVLPSCSSCVIIHSYTNEPIPPGKQGKIDFSLNLENKQGKVQTSFIIFSNAKPENVVVVTVTANILTEYQKIVLE